MAVPRFGEQDAHNGAGLRVRPKATVADWPPNPAGCSGSIASIPAIRAGFQLDKRVGGLRQAAGGKKRADESKRNPSEYVFDFIQPLLGTPARSNHSEAVVNPS